MILTNVARKGEKAEYFPSSLPYITHPAYYDRVMEVVELATSSYELRSYMYETHLVVAIYSMKCIMYMYMLVILPLHICHLSFPICYTFKAAVYSDTTMATSTLSLFNTQDGKNLNLFRFKDFVCVHDRTQSSILMLDNDRWVKIPGNHEILPFGCSLFQYGAHLCAIGGWKHEQPIKEVLIFEGKKWTTSKTIPSMIEGCCRSCAVEVKQCLVVLGGRGSGRLLDAVQVLSKPKNVWSRGKPLPVACENPSADVYEDILFVAGGWCMGTMIWSIHFSELVRKNLFPCTYA